jgi:hypothetical protein
MARYIVTIRGTFNQTLTLVFHSSSKAEDNLTVIESEYTFSKEDADSMHSGNIPDHVVRFPSAEYAKEFMESGQQFANFLNVNDYEVVEVKG